MYVMFILHKKHQSKLYIVYPYLSKLKVPKCENFELAFYKNKLSYPIWIGDFGPATKNGFFIIILVPISIDFSFLPHAERLLNFF